jgi:hypothetical protein
MRYAGLLCAAALLMGGAATGALAQAAPAAAVAPYTSPKTRTSPWLGFYDTVKPDMPTPRTADGHVDFSGNWNGGYAPPAGASIVRHQGTAEPDQMVLQRGSGGGWNKPHYKPEFWAEVRSLDFSIIDRDPAYACIGPGVPRQTNPQKIIQTEKEMFFYNGADSRFIPMDGRPRDPLDSDYSLLLGWPLGHWEGDTLVIESVGFGGESWLQFQGYFHTNRMTVTERLRRNGNLLYYQFTVNDPDVLVEPWVSDTYVRFLNKDPMVRFAEETPCDPIPIDDIADKYNRG